MTEKSVGVIIKRVSSSLLVSLMLLVIVLLMVSIVAAADVAYIYKSRPAVDDNILEVFEDMGLEVELVSENNLPDDFDDYRLLLIGDERYRHEEDIPVGTYPAVILNYYFGERWGLTDSDGVSKLAANSPLSVLLDGDPVQVYTQARFDRRSVAIPYYFLDEHNKAPGIEQIAGTYMNNGHGFGAVVGYAGGGTHLINGIYTNRNLCFFGIIESDYWTEDAKEMFEDCIDFVGVTCNSADDCGDDYEEEPYCEGGDVYRDEVEFECRDPGSIESGCYEDVTQVLVDDCTQGCLDGECIHECEEDNDCPNDYYENNYCSSGNVYRDLHEFGCDDNECVDTLVSELVTLCSYGCEGGECLPECTQDSDCGGDEICVDNSCVEIDCDEDSDCGTDGFIDGTYCDGIFDLDLYQNYREWTCENPGSVSSSCSQVITQTLITDCVDTCVDGACIDYICDNDLDCDDSNEDTEDECINPGTIDSYCTHTGISCTNNLDCDDGDPYTEDTCINGGTGDSYCEYEDLGCVTDNDCDDDFYDDNYCSNDDVFRDFYDYSCINNECIESIINELVEDCTESCVNAECRTSECDDDADCDDGSSYTYDYCNNPGTIDSYCSNEYVNCVIDNDCGVTGYVGDGFCMNDDVYIDLSEATCSDPGTLFSYCDLSVTPTLLSECGDGYCEDYQENHCSGGDVYHDRNCFNQGCEDGGCFEEFYLDSELVEDCIYGCNAGECLLECYDNSECGEGDYCNDDGECVPAVCDDDGDCDDSNDYTLDECINPGTEDSYCEYTDLQCISDLDCIGSYLGDPYCSGDDVWQDFFYNTCVDNMCVEQSDSNLVEDCLYGCLNGECLLECYLDEDCDENQVCEANSCEDVECFDDSDCDDSNAYTQDTCMNPGTSDSYCTYDDIICFDDSDCGDEYFEGQLYCSNDNVFDNYITYDCLLAGSVDSVCNADNNPTLIEDCDFGCLDGECLLECYVDSDCPTDEICVNNECIYVECFDDTDCGDSDAYTLDICINPGTVDSACTYDDIECLNDADCDDSDAYTEDTCMNPGTPSSDCTYDDITCLTDADCGTDGLEGDPFCQNDDLYDDYITYNCNDAGTVDSYCTDDAVSQLIEDCAYGCEDEECIDCVLNPEGSISFNAHNAPLEWRDCPSGYCDFIPGGYCRPWLNQDCSCHNMPVEVSDVVEGQVLSVSNIQGYTCGRIFPRPMYQCVDNAWWTCQPGGPSPQYMPVDCNADNPYTVIGFYDASGNFIEEHSVKDFEAGIVAPAGAVKAYAYFREPTYRSYFDNNAAFSCTFNVQVCGDIPPPECVVDADCDVDEECINGNCVEITDYECFVPDNPGTIAGESIYNHPAEPDLWEILASYGINVWNDQTAIESWNTNQDVELEITFINGYSAKTHAFGYYLNSNPGTFVPLFEKGNNHLYSAPIAIPGQTFTINVNTGDEVGFAIADNYGNIFYTERILNAGSADRAIIYDLTDEFLIAFEDQSDNDHQDVVVSVVRESCS